MNEAQLKEILEKAYARGAQNAYRWMQRKPGTGPQLQDLNRMQKEKNEALDPLVRELMEARP